MTEDLSDEEYERQAFRVVAMTDLPDAIVDVTKWEWRTADWAAIARVAVEVFESGVDPLDRTDVEQRIELHELSSTEYECVRWLFTDPVAVYEKTRHWSGGRHRVAAMRAAGVTRCLVQVLG